jgi:acyl carrier protein
MTREALRSDLQAIGEAVSRRPSVSWDDERTLADLGIDSAELLEIIAELEDRLSIEIPLHALERMATVGELLTEVLARVGAR